LSIAGSSGKWRAAPAAKGFADTLDLNLLRLNLDVVTIAPGHGSVVPFLRCSMISGGSLESAKTELKGIQNCNLFCIFELNRNDPRLKFTSEKWRGVRENLNNKHVCMVFNLNTEIQHENPINHKKSGASPEKVRCVPILNNNDPL